MSKPTNKKKNDTEEVKKNVKSMNVDAVANILIRIQNENHKIKSEFVDLKEIISKSTQDITELRALINELKVLGGRGTIGGTGSTVHMKDE